MTSAAYSLRGSRSADGRSYQPSRRAGNLTREQYEAALSQETQAFSLADTRAATARPGGGRPGSPGTGGAEAYRQDQGGGFGTAPYRHASDPAASMNTPPSGELYGYGDAAVASRHGRWGGDQREERQTHPQGSGYRTPWYLGDGYQRPDGSR